MNAKTARITWDIETVNFDHCLIARIFSDDRIVAEKRFYWFWASDTDRNHARRHAEAWALITRQQIEKEARNELSKAI